MAHTALSLAHLNLTVVDVERSIAFYRRWFGFDSDPQRHEDGTAFIRDAHGFDLALHAAPEPGANSTGMHFGFRADNPGAVRSLRSALTEVGITITESYDEDAFVNFKGLDPDGYAIEVYWDAASTPARAE